ncbi:hypothetical protein ACVWZA_000955 [Sphingomonas sp. UYAg733]
MAGSRTAIAQRIDQQREPRGGLTAAAIIAVMAGKGLAPFVRLCVKP